MGRMSQFQRESRLNKCPVCGDLTANKYRCSTCWDNISTSQLDYIPVTTGRGRPRNNPNAFEAYNDPIKLIIEHAIYNTPLKLVRM